MQWTHTTNNEQQTMASIQRQPSSSSSWTYTRGLKYLDGSMYKGQLDRYGRRFGTGTMRNPMCIYGAYDPENSAALVHWREYSGEWRNNLPNGHGIVRKYHGDGTCTTVHEGEWVNGQPAPE